MTTDSGGRVGEYGLLPDRWADALASRFHEAYERLAPEFGYDTRPDSAVPWEDVPEANRLLMQAVVRDLFDPQMASSKDHEGYWFQSSDMRGWQVLTVRPMEQSGSNVTKGDA